MLTRVSRTSSICSKGQLWGQRLWSYTTRWTLWYFFKYFVWAYKKVQLNQFFVNSFAYYGLTMNIGDLAADNVYLNFAVSGGFQEKCILTKKQLIERYRTSRDPKLWLGHSHLAVRRAQNSIFRVRVDNFDDNWHTDENHETNENFTELIFQVNAPLWNLTALHFLSARRPTHPCPCNCALWWALVLPLRRFSKGLIFNNNFFSGKMCITFSFGVIFLYGAELFPTEIRTSGLGSASFVGRFFTSITLS